MNYFAKKLKVPSAAITAMIDGLRYQDEREEFEIDMETFGRSCHYGKCYGCAATCTIQEIMGKNFTAQKISSAIDRAIFFGERECSYHDLVEIEGAIDLFGRGATCRLLKMFKSNPEPILVQHQDWVLENNNWKQQLHKIEKYRDMLVDMEA